MFSKSDKSAQSNGKAGTTHQNGFKVAKVVVPSTIKNRCFKCGELKGFFHTCKK